MTAPDSLPLHALAEDDLAAASPDLWSTVRPLSGQGSGRVYSGTTSCRRTSGDGSRAAIQRGKSSRYAPCRKPGPSDAVQGGLGVP
jgi:hypothetical protein